MLNTCGPFYRCVGIYYISIRCHILSGNSYIFSHIVFSFFISQKGRTEPADLRNTGISPNIRHFAGRYRYDVVSNYSPYCSRIRNMCSGSAPGKPESVPD